MVLKRLHKLTILSFLPPFFISLFISVFLFFLVQVVITYLDDMIGKGLRAWDLIKLFVYAWIAIVPQCIPLSVLLASIMSFGNFAEHYELAAMKSSGISLFRILRPVFGVILFLAMLTFLFNNFILPVVHLKFTSLLYDIRQKKPAVNIREGIFYNGIENYSIRVGKKSANKDTLLDIYIYDHSQRRGNNIQMYAKNGKLHVSPDTAELLLFMRDGNRYEELQPDYNSPSKTTMTQLNFRQLELRIPLQDFKFKRTNEELFKGNEEMLNVWQIDSVADSTKRMLNRRLSALVTNPAFAVASRTSSAQRKLVPVVQFYDSLKQEQFVQCLQNALNLTRTASANMEMNSANVENERNTLRRFLIEWHKKIVISFACIVLFFVGAPLGAIIKKGGLGLPVVVSVIFFLGYYILTEMFMQFALEGTMPPWFAMWMPLAIFLPVSIFLTYKAANDSALFDLTFYYSRFERFFSRTPQA
jgi:lipopolysaccharide export system permease protein